MLSACIITKNEEKYLPRLLASLAPLDDVFVLDTGSEDRTLEIAKSFPNVHVAKFKWTGSFSDARNSATLGAKHDWLMWLDADMWFEPGELEKLKAFIPTMPAHVDGVMMRVVDGAASFISPRVYKRGNTFTGTVHENPSCKASIQVPFTIMHQRDESPADRAYKDGRYKEILLAELEACPKSVHALMYLRDYSFNARDFSLCATYCRRLLEVEQDYQCHYLLGLIAYERQDWQGTIDHAFGALKACGTSPKVYTLLGDTYDEMGRKLDALVWYEHAARLPPEARFMGAKYAVTRDDYDVVPRVNQAKVYVDMGLKDKALACYDDALRAYPETSHRTAIEKNKATLKDKS
jgi:glycosyltransferase involved in cell wall biosynthesis